ncbi:MAG: hypothetical protein JHC72_04230 [Candidatus Nanopelagicus sp.]|jgi:hypothetical protein|nr:hypothetical protein [Candidatus Nanopelagicus sp.]
MITIRRKAFFYGCLRRAETSFFEVPSIPMGLIANDGVHMTQNSSETANAQVVSLQSIQQELARFKGQIVVF